METKIMVLYPEVETARSGVGQRVGTNCHLPFDRNSWMGSKSQLRQYRESNFRIFQPIPSPKAEPFKRWLAKVGYERVQEIEDPELTTKRTQARYKAMGYSDNWNVFRTRLLCGF